MMHDIEFLSGINDRTSSAFLETYDRYFRPLKFYASKLLNNPSEGESISIEAMLNLWSSEALFNSIPHFYGYLRTSIKNLCIDEHRNKQRERNLVNELTNIAEDSEDPGLFRLDIQFIINLRNEIFELINDLPTNQRKVIQLAFKDRKSNTEIANLLNISYESVGNTKFKALAKLKATAMQKFPGVDIETVLWPLLIAILQIYFTK